MKRILSSLVTLLVFVLFISSIVPTASASSGASLTPEAVLENYLTAVKNQDIEKVREYSVDERNLSVEEQKEIFEYEKLLDYKVLKSEVKNESLNKYLLETTYEGDLVTQAPVQVKKINSEWKVFISSETLTSDENKIVDQGNTEYFKEAFSQKDVVQPMDVLLVWNFWDRVGKKVFYSSSKFSVPGVTSLKLGIAHQLSTTPSTTSITYAVVRKGTISDTVWGGRRVDGHFYDKTYTVSGNSSSFSGAQLRFTPNGSGTYSGSGGVDW